MLLRFWTILSCNPSLRLRSSPYNHGGILFGYCAMASNNFADSRGDREIRLLQFLCDAAKDESARSAMIRTLADYAWLDADNEILFETIRGLFARNPRDLPSHLPAELTRRGFPDLPWEPLKQRSLLGPDEAAALAGELLRSPK